MTDLIIFMAGENYYAMDLKRVERIIQLPALRPVPNAHAVVSEMMSYEGRVINVVDFRKLVGIATYEEELRSMFEKHEQEHREWFDALSNVLTQEGEFNLITDPHRCELGRWFDGFISYDEGVSVILKKLNAEHKKLHRMAKTLAELYGKDKDAALLMLQSEVYETYAATMGLLEELMDKLDVVAATLQKLLICHGEESDFAIKVDSIVDIFSIDEATVSVSDTIQTESAFVKIEGVMEHEGMLINIINSVTLPTSEGHDGNNNGE